MTTRNNMQTEHCNGEVYKEKMQPEENANLNKIKKSTRAKKLSNPKNLLHQNTFFPSNTQACLPGPKEFPTSVQKNKF